MSFEIQLNIIIDIIVMATIFWYLRLSVNRVEEIKKRYEVNIIQSILEDAKNSHQKIILLSEKELKNIAVLEKKFL